MLASEILFYCKRSMCDNQMASELFLCLVMPYIIISEQLCAHKYRHQFACVNTLLPFC